MQEMEKSTGKPHLLYRMHLFCFSQFLDRHSSWSNSASKTVLQTEPSSVFSPTESLSESRGSSSYITVLTWKIKVTISEHGREPNNTFQTGATGGTVGSGTAGSTGIFQGHNPSGLHYGPGVNSASNRKMTSEQGWQPYHLHVPIMSWNLETSTSLYPLGLSKHVQGLLYLYFYISNCYKIHINQYHISIISYLTSFCFRSYTALRLSSVTVYLRIFWNFRTYHLTKSFMWLCITQYFIHAQVIYRRYHKGPWDTENVKSHVHIHMSMCTYCYE